MRSLFRNLFRPRGRIRPGKPGRAVGCDCDRFVEFWNLVFSQFNSDGNGNYVWMEHPNIDTGMGLERLACIGAKQVDNLFEVDTVQNIMKHISQIAGVTYKEDDKPTFLSASSQTISEAPPL